MVCRVGSHDVSKMFGPVRAPYFQTRTIFLRFCVGSRPVDPLAGIVLTPTGQMAHNQVLPAKLKQRCLHGPHWALYCPAWLIIRICSNPFMAFAGAHTVPAYMIVFPSPYEIHRNPYGARTWTLRNPLGYAYGILRCCGQRTCRELIERPYACNKNIACGWYYTDFKWATGPGLNR